MIETYEDEMRRLLIDAAPDLAVRPGLAGEVTRAGRRRRRMSGAVASVAVLTVATVLAAGAVRGWAAPWQGLVRPATAAAPERLVGYGAVTVRVPEGWNVSDHPPATWCDARPRTVYLGGTVRLFPVVPASGPMGRSQCGDRAPATPLIWVGDAAESMGSPLPVERFRGGGLGRVQLSGVGASDDGTASADFRQMLMIKPIGDRVQLFAVLPPGADQQNAPAITRDAVDDVLGRVSIRPAPLAGGIGPLPDLVGALVAVTDDPDPQHHRGRERFTDSDQRALAALLHGLRPARVDPSSPCFGAVSAAGLVDLKQFDLRWQAFRSRWPGAVYGFGGSDVLVGGPGCPYVIDTRGGAAVAPAGLIDRLLAV